MADEEADALDVLLHLLQPEVVVETGTNLGCSARFLANHAKVVTMETNFLRVDPSWFVGAPHPVIHLEGTSPRDLDRFVPYLAGVERWLFWHDSYHTADVLLAEVAWAFRHGALAALWHDAGDRQEVDHGQTGSWRDQGTMLDGLRDLQHHGFTALRLLDCGGEEDAHSFTGIGLCWPRLSGTGPVSRFRRAGRWFGRASS